MSPEKSAGPSRTAPIPATSGGGAPSAIADVSYRNYDGELRTRALRWWTISAATIRANVNRKKLGFWIPLVLTLLFYFFQGIGFYFNHGLQAKMQAMGAPTGDQPANPYTLSLYQVLSVTPLFVAVAAMTVGAAVIAADNRANALLVYLSKPITRSDYLIGKWMGVFALLLTITLVPALMLFLFFAVAYYDEGFLKQNSTLILRVLAVSIIEAAIHTSLILGFSAWSKTPRLAGAMYAALYFVSGILAGTIGSVLNEKDASHARPQLTAIVSNLSVDGATNGIAMSLYDVTPQQVAQRLQNGGRRRPHFFHKSDDDDSATPPTLTSAPERPKLPIMLLFGAALIGVPVGAAFLKVRAVEVVRG